MVLNLTQHRQEQINTVSGESNFKIYQFMIDDMRLTGAELMTYALIYSYFASETPFTLSRCRIAQRTAGSRATVDRSLSSLLKKGYINKLDTRGITTEYAIRIEGLPDIPMHKGYLDICRADKEEQRRRSREEYYSL